MAIESLKKVKQPSSSTVAKLAKLYPSSSSRPMRRLADTFDPLQECVALPAKKAKKAACVKPVTVDVIVLPASHSMIVPRGKQRHTLANSGRVKNVQFKRTMSSLQVKNAIVKIFDIYFLYFFIFLFMLYIYIYIYFFFLILYIYFLYFLFFYFSIFLFFNFSIFLLFYFMYVVL